MSMFQKSSLEQLLSPKKFSKEQLDIYAKQMAVSFFQWNAKVVSSYIDYISRGGSELFEGATIEERYDMYLEYLKNKNQ